MNAILNNWTIMRLIRLGLGIVACIQAFIIKDAAIGLLGAFLLLTAITNTRCCGSTGCAVNLKKNKKNNTQDIHYETIDAKK